MIPILSTLYTTTQDHKEFMIVIKPSVMRLCNKEGATKILGFAPAVKENMFSIRHDGLRPLYADIIFDKIWRWKRYDE